MKKTIALASALIMLLTCLCSCNAEKPSESNSDLIDDAENNYDQNMGDNNEQQHENFSTLTYYGSPVAVAKSNTGQGIAYIKDWDEYYELPSSYIAIDSFELIDIASAVYGDTAWLFDMKNPTMTVYIITRGSKTIPYYESNYTDSDTFSSLFVAYADFYNENCGYLFYWLENDRQKGWPLQYLKTTDGGKTWIKQESDTYVAAGGGQEYPNYAKFLSDDVGIMSYRYLSLEDLCDRTYITTNGGKTWELIPNLPYPDPWPNFYYSEVANFEYFNGEYRLTVLICANTRYYIEFISTDLASWKTVN